MSKATIRQVTARDLDRCCEIEFLSFSSAEAASREKIAKRISTYPEGFTVLETNGEIAGFINAGATHEVQLSDEAFKDLEGHDPTGAHVVIMSVVVHPDFRGLGLSASLMIDFIERMRTLGKEDIYLICQQELVAMYAKYGFVDLGPSASSHGGKCWHEMVLALQTGVAQNQPE